MEQAIGEFIQSNPGIFVFGILIVTIWHVSWDGMALWRSAQNKDKKWFIAILLLNTLGILEILYLYHFSKEKVDDEPNVSKMGKEGRIARTSQKEQNKDTILGYLNEKGRITNKEATNLLSVSDSTATNYFDELEEAGKIIQHGDVGKYVYYELKK